MAVLGLRVSAPKVWDPGFGAIYGLQFRVSLPFYPESTDPNLKIH